MNSNSKNRHGAKMKCREKAALCFGEFWRWSSWDCSSSFHACCRNRRLQHYNFFTVSICENPRPSRKQPSTCASRRVIHYAALRTSIGGETVRSSNGQIHFSEPICPDSVKSS